MKNLFLSREDSAALIRSGAMAVFAGSEDALRTLPKGDWIGGTTPYFMTAEGGVVDRENLFCTVFEEALETKVVMLTASSLPDIAHGRFADGFSYVLMPAFSDVHSIYAIEGPAYEGLCDQPVMGWVTGVLLSELGTRTPKVFDGSTGKMHDAAALVMHVHLPVGASVELDIVNLFVQGKGAEIVFPANGFSAGACTVDGLATNYAHYVKKNGIDIKLPLVADYAGAQVNVALQSVDEAAGMCNFYAPVMAGETYRLAEPVAEYGAAYAAGLGNAADAGRMLSCNCILNFLYAELEGKRTAGFVGPVTFGEIAYVLLNQTLVRLSVGMPVSPAKARPVPAMA